MVKAKKWVLVKNFVGEPTDENFQFVEEELPELKDNEILLEALYLSVDPYVRRASDNLKAPFDMIGVQTARVIQTKNGKFPVGSIVLSHAGWKSHWISKDGSDLKWFPIDLGSTPYSYTLGVLGRPGATAYFGLKLLQPKAGETLILNGAAGAVGTIVGQLAKIKGVRVIAFVGSDDKLALCKDELGFDHVFNYKKVDFSEEIAKLAPDGAEMFFDNVGGDYYWKILNKHMKKYGRATICGSIENYNDKEPRLYPATNRAILSKELRVQGIMISSYEPQWPEAFTELKKLIDEDKLKVQETVYDGLEKMKDAFFGLFKGENTGKAVIKA